jgi:hypothetical protein
LVRYIVRTLGEVVDFASFESWTEYDHVAER